MRKKTRGGFKAADCDEFRPIAGTLERVRAEAKRRPAARVAMIKSINAGIDRGLADTHAGWVTDFEEAAVEWIMRRGMARLKALKRR